MHIHTKIDRPVKLALRFSWTYLVCWRCDPRITPPTPSCCNTQRAATFATLMPPEPSVAPCVLPEASLELCLSAIARSTSSKPCKCHTHTNKLSDTYIYIYITYIYIYLLRIAECEILMEYMTPLCSLRFSKVPVVRPIRCPPRRGIGDTCTATSGPRPPPLHQRIAAISNK